MTMFTFMYKYFAADGDKDYVEPNMTKEIDVESSHEFCKSTSTDTEQSNYNFKYIVR